MHPPQLLQTPQDCSTSHIPHVSHGRNLYMSPHPTATSIPLATPSACVYSGLTPQYTPLSHIYYAPETPIPPHKKRRIDDETLPSFGSPTPEADNPLRIEALTAEIKRLQNRLDQLTKVREMLGYKKRAPRLRRLVRGSGWPIQLAGSFHVK